MSDYMITLFIVVGPICVLVGTLLVMMVLSQKKGEIKIRFLESSPTKLKGKIVLNARRAIESQKLVVALFAVNEYISQDENGNVSHTMREVYRKETVIAEAANYAKDATKRIAFSIANPSDRLIAELRQKGGKSFCETHWHLKARLYASGLDLEAWIKLSDRGIRFGVSDKETMW